MKRYMLLGACLCCSVLLTGCGDGANVNIDDIPAAEEYIAPAITSGTTGNIIHIDASSSDIEPNHTVIEVAEADDSESSVEVSDSQEGTTSVQTVEVE